MENIKLLAAVYLSATSIIYLKMIWEDDGNLTIKFLGSNKKISKRVFIFSNLFDGFLMAICAYVLLG